jgi:hypothetical protein
MDKGKNTICTGDKSWKGLGGRLIYAGIVRNHVVGT